MNERNEPSWIHQRDQSAAANREMAGSLADTYKGLREEGLSVFEASLIGGTYWGHIMLGIYKDRPKDES